MRNKRSILAAAACALGLAVPLAAANGPTSSKTKTATKATTKAKRSAWPPETLSAKIAMVDPSHKRVVLETSDQVTYVMVVTAKTKIKSGNQALTLNDLSQDKNKTASVNFTPERRGDVATQIRIGG
jgi:hypothetical protein